LDLRQRLHSRSGPDIDTRLDRFAETLVARAREGAVDEIVLVGHSLGAMLVLDVCVRALARNADFGRRGVAVSALTIGATIPKFALHPRAQGVRRTIARIVAQPSIGWTEYQSRADTISFYKFDQGQAAGARRCTLATAARRGRFTFVRLPWSVATRPGRLGCLRQA